MRIYTVVQGGNPVGSDYLSQKMTGGNVYVNWP